MHSITMVTLMLTVFLLRDAFAQSAVQLTAVKDNTLYEDLGGSLSNGAGDHFFAGRTTGLLGAPLIRRGLLAFNIADSITAGSTIDSVVLRLHMSRTNTLVGPNPRTVELRRVLSNWGEGASHAVLQEGQGAPAMPNDATWLHTFFNTTFWSNPGGDFLSNGAGDHFFAGRTTGLLGAPLIRRGLLAFNIADSITAGSTIDSVVLRLHMSRTNTLVGPNPRTVELRRVLSNWGEGASHAVLQEGQGAPAMPNDATWLHTFFNTTFWSNPGGDFLSTASASQSVSDTGFYTWGSTSQMVADVQDWLDNPATNFGWLVLGDESSPTTTKRFDSRQNLGAAHRPVLTVAYTGVVSIEEPREDFPFDFSIGQNYPNPFNPATILHLGLHVPNGG